ncbi:MAG: nucleotidyltransferase family protein [Methylocystaceae bacterium]|nr:nucleotidyltransferase family protein [Methylocystaceae bacterium]
MKLACLVLAAGGSSRFDGTKQLASIHGVPMVEAVLKELVPLFKGNLYCSLGANAEDIKPYVIDTASVITFKDWSLGMGATLAYSISKILETAPDLNGILVALGDQVALKTQDYEKLIHGFTGDVAIAAQYADLLGVPAIFPKSSFKSLLDLKGDTGARKLLKDKNVVGVPLPTAEIDIDTQTDLLRYCKR